MLYLFMHAYVLSHTHSSVQVYLTVKIYRKTSFDSIEKFGIFRVGSGAGMVGFFVVWFQVVDLILIKGGNFSKFSQEAIRKKVLNPREQSSHEEKPLPKTPIH